MKSKNFMFKLAVLLAFVCFGSINVMATEVCESENDSISIESNDDGKLDEVISIIENAKPSDSAGENRDIKVGADAVKHEEVDGFKYLKGLQVSDNSANSILIYEHEQTKMKIVVISHDYVKVLESGDFDYYLFFRIKDGVTENGMRRYDLKHALEHLLALVNYKNGFFKMHYDYIFGSSGANSANFGNATTTGSGISFEFRNLDGLKEVFNQLANPYFKTEEGMKLFGREVKGERTNKETNETYGTGRVLSEILNHEYSGEEFGSFLDDKGDLRIEFSELINFLSEGKPYDTSYSTSYPNSSNNLSNFSGEEIYAGVCEIFDEMTEDLSESVLVLPNYADIPNTPGYKDMMRYVDVRCLSNFKGHVDSKKERHESKVRKFEGKPYKSQPYKKIAEGVKENSKLFNYRINNANGEEEYRTKYLAFLKVDLGDDYSDAKQEAGRRLFSAKQVEDKVKQLGYKYSRACIENLADKSYLLIKLYGDNEDLFKEDKLKETYGEMLEVIPKLSADKIYESRYGYLKGKKEDFDYNEELQNQLSLLIRTGKEIFEITGGFYDKRIKLAYDEFKNHMEFVKDGRYVTDPAYVKEKYVNDIKRSMGALDEFKNRNMEILVLQCPSNGGRVERTVSSMEERYRKAGPTYEAHFKLKDGLDVNPAARFSGLSFLVCIGIASEMDERGVFYGLNSGLMRTEFDGKNSKFYLIFPTKEKGGFDEFFNTQGQFKATVDRVLNELKEEDFNRFKKKVIEDFESYSDEGKEYSKNEDGYGLEDLKTMTLDEVKKVIGSVELEWTKFFLKQ